METAAIIFSILLLIVTLGFSHWSVYNFGVSAERMKVIDRALDATEIFFANLEDSEFPNWHTSSSLIAYVAGAEDRPNPRYVVSSLTGTHLRKENEGLTGPS